MAPVRRVRIQSCCAAIFQMGVPISGKNHFPSNIAGLPTWYTIRANKDGYIGRKKEIDFLVAMNAETAQDDVMSLAPAPPCSTTSRSP
jgi:2-oxoglutarate/2-oxoacid ferredoxin oxidoreductase subunit alpha